MRGELGRSEFAGNHRGRFIPACAGNSVSGVFLFTAEPVHPRLRGELLRNLSCIQILAGSSPLARGTQSPGFFCSPQNRFIPACAGNSIELNKPIICSPVHPRLRGELRFHLLGARFLIGSSPLARGTRLNTLGSRFFRRFIPACAGNSQSGNRVDGHWPVHPRLRGELLHFFISDKLFRGSSPLARGTHLKWLQHYTNRLTAKLLKNISKQE